MSAKAKAIPTLVPEPGAVATTIPTSTENHEDPQAPEQPEIDRNTAAQDVLYYAPITRIDREKREVIGTATAEIKDSYKTVIGYEASKDALTRWAGNVREMHNPQMAVGRALEVTPDPENKRVIVRATISKGAEDTWQKVLDGTLTGFSIGGRNGQWTERIIDGEKLPYLERYDAVELSLVDNPSCPGCDVAIVRADGMASEALATDAEFSAPATPIARTHNATIERAGARLSAETMTAMHTARDHAQSSLEQMCNTCGCDDCIGVIAKVHTDDNAGGEVNPATELAPGATRAMIAEIVREQVAETLRAQIAPAISRVNALLAHEASRNEPDFTRSFTALTERNDALTAKLNDVLVLVEQIAAQPADGGPVLHGAPVDKRLAMQSNTARADDADIIRRATELGFGPPSDPQQAVRAAAALMRPIRR